MALTAQRNVFTGDHVLRVLIVEDERNIRLLISSILQPLGYHVVEATNGLEALLQLAQTADIGLIISDVRMPELDGIDLTEEVKRVYPNIPVIIVSAFSDDAMEAVERGADYFIVKPFTRDQLIAIVRTAALTPSNPAQQGMISRLSNLLGNLIPDGRVLTAPISVHLDDQHVVEPDVVWVAADSQSKIRSKSLEGAPDLIVDVLSAGVPRNDKGNTLDVYCKHGVREYWLLDTKARATEVWVADGQRFERLGSFGVGESFVSPLLAKTVDLSPIFPER